MTEPLAHTFTVDASGRRLDQFLAEHVDSLSRSFAQHLIEGGHVSVQGVAVQRPSHRLRMGDCVRLVFPELNRPPLQPEAISLKIVYEDEDMLVIDKPAGLVVHPSPGHELHTLVHALLARYPKLPGINGTARPGIVHRLDLDTSGLLMVAKSERGMRSLSEQLAERRVRKGYLALITGHVNPPGGVIEAPIARDPMHRERMAVVAGGRAATTLYRELARGNGWTVLLAMPQTGRTHQIRVHLAAIGHPIIGDRLYGGDGSVIERQFLHAFALRFARPCDDLPVQCVATLPGDLIEPLCPLLTESGAVEPCAAWVERMLGSGLREFEALARDAVLRSKS